MNDYHKQSFNEEDFIMNSQSFSNWSPLNDSIMGGNSQAECTINQNGLQLTGYLVEKGGGFVSFRSPLFNPPLNLSKYRGLNVQVDGEGRTLKFALYCKCWMSNLNDIFASGLHWVTEIPTLPSGTTSLEIPFSSFLPTIRAKEIPFSLELDSSAVTQFQLLHSKFGLPGLLNASFRPGKINILLRSISGY